VGTGAPVAVIERMNRAMRQRTSQALPASGLDPALQVLLDAGFVERDGCVFLAAEFALGARGRAT
jgi:hypothetical protein